MIHLNEPFYQNIRASELRKRYTDKYISFVKIGNIYTAILSDRVPGDLRVVSMTETQKVPLWKVQQNMMMGRPYRTEKEDTRIYRTVMIPENMEDRYMYRAYFVKDI